MISTFPSMPTTSNLTDRNFLVHNRYSKQILFSNIGEKGQKLLERSFAIILGCGALGSVSASLLTRAGVGRIKIIDRDFIEENNLQRQILFDEEDIKKGLPKAIAAQEKLRKINSSLVIEGVVSDVNYTNIENLMAGADVVIDGLDNFETRFLLNDYCVKNNTPWIYGACIGSTGLTMNIVPQKTPCLRCILESLPPSGTSPTCDTAGIIGSIATVTASIQATEAIKLLTRNIDAMSKDLIEYDIWDGKIQKIQVSNAENQVPSPSMGEGWGRGGQECPTCKQGEYEFLNASQGTWTTTICGRNGVQIIPTNPPLQNGSNPPSPPFVKGGIGGDLEKLASKLRPLGDVKFNNFMLKFKPAQNGSYNYELTIFPDGRAIITGTNDPAVAKGLYTKYIGL